MAATQAGLDTSDRHRSPLLSCPPGTHRAVRRRRIAILGALLLLAVAVTGQSKAPPAHAHHLAEKACQYTITITVGADGLDDDSLETVWLRGRPLLSNATGLPFQRGGADAHETFAWDVHLDDCVPPWRDDIDDFDFGHVSGDDDWDLYAVKIVAPGRENPVYEQTGAILNEPSPTPSPDPLHRFLRNNDTTWSPVTHTDTDFFVDGNRCKITVDFTTGDDGLRHDSVEVIWFGKQPLMYEGTHQPFQRGTTDARRQTYVWHGYLYPCASGGGWSGDLVIQHLNWADGTEADNWNLQRLQISDDDTGALYYDDESFDQSSPLHRFKKDTEQRWPARPDADADGLPDNVELNGFTWLRHNDNGPDTLERDTWLADHGADPCRKTVAVEVDWLADGTVSHRPFDAALDMARSMFDAAPQPRTPPDACPYDRYDTGPAGVQLMIDIGPKMVDPTAHGNEIRVVEGARTQKLFPFTTGICEEKTERPFDAYRAQNFDRGRTGLFRYNLWGYQVIDGVNYKASGLSNIGPICSDFLVTAGHYTDGVGTTWEQASFFVHELGHALGLWHGGDDDRNRKPNYLSVMNYQFQIFGQIDFVEWQREFANLSPGEALDPAIAKVSRLDYSHRTLDSIDPMNLDETVGVKEPAHLLTAWHDPDGWLRVGDASGPLDWNWSGDIVAKDSSHPVRVDVGLAGICIGPENRVDATMASSPQLDDFVSHVNLGIFAGRFGRCDTTATAPDVPIRAVGYNYHEKYANPTYYPDDGLPPTLDGHDDWANLIFSASAVYFHRQTRGISPPHAEITREQYDAARVELKDALVAAAAPRTVDGFPFGEITNAADGTAAILVSRNSAGATNHLTRSGPGVYTAWFQNIYTPGPISATGAPMVRTLGPAGIRCQVSSYGGPYGYYGTLNELVSVRCFDSAGAPADAQFTVTYVRNGTISGHGGHQGGYAVPLNAAADTTGPTLEMQYNSAFTVQDRYAVINQSTLGTYVFTLPRLRGADGIAHAVAIYGNSIPRFCSVTDRTSVEADLKITVKCTGPDGKPAQTGISLMFER